MDINDRKRIHKLRDLLIENLTFSEIQDCLYQEDVITASERQAIQSKSGDDRKIRKLLGIIERKPSKGLLKHFCHVIRSTEFPLYVCIADQLENVDISDVNDIGLDNIDLNQSNEKILSSQLQKAITEFCRQQVARLLKEHLQKKPEEHQPPLENQPPAINGDDGLDTIDNLRSKNGGLEDVTHSQVEMKMISARFANKYLSEFRCKPRDAFTQIETVACLLGATISAELLGSDYVNDIVDINLQNDIFMNEVVQTMSRLVKDMLLRHSDEFEDMINKLDPQDMIGYNTMDLIADELFNEDMEINWGRIIAWFALWARFLKLLHPLESENPQEFVKFYGEYFGFFLAKKLHLWIAGAGGWVGMQ